MTDDGTGVTFDAPLSLWDGDPNDGGRLVAGPVEPNEDGSYTFPPEVIETLTFS